MKYVPHLLWAALVVLVPAWAVGQAIAGAPGDSPKSPPDKPVTVSLVVRPAAEPREALKYRLLPGVMERKPGNAALVYYKAAMYVSEKDWQEAGNKVSEWLDKPLAELPRGEAAALLAKFRSVLDDLDLAARRERCDWELPLRERSFVTLLLPELQKLREYGRLLALKARLHIAEGRLEEALRTLQTGYALARHAAEGPTLINALVGTAICQMISQRVQELAQQPGAPNLYWALTSLPQPMIDMTKALEYEGNFLYLSFPELQELNDTSRSPEYWQYTMDRWIQRLGEFGDSPRLSQWQGRLGAVAFALKGYPTAKRALIEHGRPAAVVEAMPVPQVVAIYTMETYNEMRDQIFKWFPLPYAEAREGIDKAYRYFESEGRNKEIVPLASLLLPALGNVKVAEARNERTFAALRVVEALRLYGAAHEGRLPEKLDEIKEVPVPNDPMTGKPFTYHKSAEVAVLESPAPPGRDPRNAALRWEIKFAK